MHPALLGSIAALSWGTADFVARFAGRAVGPVNAAFAAMAISLVAQSALILLGGYQVPWRLEGWWLVAVTGVAVALAYVWFYAALARGAVSVVSALVATYPAFVVIFAVVTGVRPSILAWGAMAAVMAGAFVVAHQAEAEAGEAHVSSGGVAVTIVLALSAALAFAVAITAGQEATRIYGEAQAVWLSRFFTVAVIVPFVLFGRERRFHLPWRWWPAFAVMGLFDIAALVSLYAAGHNPGGEIAAVVSSGFGAVTILLARVILRERITALQWAGIAAIFAGVAVLSGQG